ncbi:MAG: alpha/beta fold hydrolase [Bacteroidota bacterium]
MTGNGTESMHTSTFQWNDQPVATRRIGHGRPLILIHGWGSDSSALQPLARTLSSIRTCHLLDLPGFGQSPEPDRPFSVDDYTDLVSDWIDSIGDPPIDLLVHSYGSRIALKLLSRPDGRDRFDKVLITGGAGLTPKRTLAYYRKRTLATLLKTPLKILPSKLRQKASSHLRQTRIWKSLGSSDYNKLSGVMRETFVRSVTEPLDDTLPKIEQEILLVWGAEDKVTPLEQGHRMEKGIRNAVLVPIDGAGHYAFLDRPNSFSAIAKAYYEPAAAVG